MAGVARNPLWAPYDVEVGARGGRLSLGSEALKLAPGHLDGPAGCSENLRAAGGHWDFPLSRSEKVERLLKLFGDEVVRNHEELADLEVTVTELAHESRGFQLDLEKAEAEVGEWKEYASGLRRKLRRSSGEVGRLSDFNSELQEQLESKTSQLDAHNEALHRELLQKELKLLQAQRELEDLRRRVAVLEARGAAPRGTCDVAHRTAVAAAAAVAAQSIHGQEAAASHIDRVMNALTWEWEARWRARRPAKPARHELPERPPKDAEEAGATGSPPTAAGSAEPPDPAAEAAVEPPAEPSLAASAAPDPPAELEGGPSDPLADGLAEPPAEPEIRLAAMPAVEPAAVEPAAEEEAGPATRPALVQENCEGCDQLLTGKRERCTCGRAFCSSDCHKKSWKRHRDEYHPKHGGDRAAGWAAPSTA